MYLFTTAAIALVMAVTTVGDQKTTQIGPGAAGSPHVRSEWTIDGAAISIEYGRQNSSPSRFRTHRPAPHFTLIGVPRGPVCRSP
jgi:hypothetical protein